MHLCFYGSQNIWFFGYTAHQEVKRVIKVIFAYQEHYRKYRLWSRPFASAWVCIMFNEKYPFKKQAEQKLNFKWLRKGFAHLLKSLRGNKSLCSRNHLLLRLDKNGNIACHSLRTPQWLSSPAIIKARRGHGQHIRMEGRLEGRREKSSGFHPRPATCVGESQDLCINKTAHTPFSHLC